jgi:hypothetical protein
LATKVGDSFLILGLATEDDENSDKVYCTVDGAYDLSPAGKQFESKITRMRGLWSTD